MLIIGTVSPTKKKKNKEKKGTRQKGSVSLKEGALSRWSQTPRCLLPSRQLTLCPSQLPGFPKKKGSAGSSHASARISVLLTGIQMISNPTPVRLRRTLPWTV